jgi:hypothetical protein
MEAEIPLDRRNLARSSMAPLECMRLRHRRRAGIHTLPLRSSIRLRGPAAAGLRDRRAIVGRSSIAGGVYVGGVTPLMQSATYSGNAVPISCLFGQALPGWKREGSTGSADVPLQRLERSRAPPADLGRDAGDRRGIAWILRADGALPHD